MNLRSYIPSHFGVRTFAFALAACSCMGACRPAPAGPPPPRAVAVADADALTRPPVLLLPATAHSAVAASPGGSRDYRVDVDLPQGVRPRPAAGAWVLLPIVRHNRVWAARAAAAPGRLSLSLKGQVQKLDGRGVQVELSLEPRGLFTVDFGALSSPRGLGVRVFAVRDGKARGVDVALLDVLQGGHALVAGALRPGEPVVVQGLDDLLDGDPVRTLSSREAL